MAWMQNQAYVKKKNTLMLLDMIAQVQPVSRTKLAEMTELSPASVTRIVNTLISLGYVREEGRAENAGRGRKARILQTCAEGMYSLGLCLEKRKLILSVHDFHQQLIYRAERALDFSGVCDARAVAHMAADMLKDAESRRAGDWPRLRTAGISVSGLVDNRNGVVIKSDQMGWDNAPLRAPLEDALGLPVWVENDAKACLLGERARRRVPHEEDTAYLLIGHGLGLAATGGGKLLRGCRNSAGEIERLNVMPNVNPGDTIRAHLVEEEILRAARQAEPPIWSMEELMASCRQGVPFALERVADFVQYLQIMLAMIDCFYNPESIILGGPTVQCLAPALRERIQPGHVSLGEDYETACTLGASIGAQRYALDKLFSGE